MPEIENLRLQLLRARASLLALDNMSEIDRRIVHDFLDATDLGVGTQPQATQTIEQKILSDIEGLIKARGAILPAKNQSLNELLQSPPFYFFFGCFLIVMAFIATQINLNTSLTFLVAMLGVAILLYGTGSQAAGTFGDSPQTAQALLANQTKTGGDAGVETPLSNSPQQTSTQPTVGRLGNVAIAGGAAVLTAAFGWGVIEYASEIRQVFRDHDQYVQVRVEFCDGDTGECSDKPQSDNTRALPTALSGNLRSYFLQVAYMETRLGERAYARELNSAIEFVLFRRDLGADGMVRIFAKVESESGLVYAASNDFFSVDSALDCVSPGVDLTKCEIYATDNSRDAERIPILTLRVAISQEPVKTIPTNNGTSIQVDEPVEPS
jgi:hypothetical protein